MLHEIEESQGWVMAGLREAIAGKLSSDLMPTNTLLNILQTIVMEGVPLLFSPNEENLHLFYEVMQLEVRSTRHMDTLMMYLAVPLPGIQLDMFRVQSFPRPVPNSHVFVKTKISASFLLVSESRDLFIEMEGLDSCRLVLPDLYVCPVQQALHRQGYVRTCLSTVFFGDPQDDATCDEVILTDFVPVMVRDRDRWLYSVPRPMEIIITYREEGITKPRETLGVGIL